MLKLILPINLISKMTQRNYLESIIIPSNGQEIMLKMKNSKQNNDTDFYQALWWYDIFHYEDQNTLNSFIDKYYPNVEKNSPKYSSISNINENDLEYLAKIMRKRSIKEYENFFGI